MKSIEYLIDSDDQCQNEWLIFMFCDFDIVTMGFREKFLSKNAIRCSFLVKANE